MFSKKIGIDLGTCNSLVFLSKKGIILSEPSVVAVDLLENKILAVGEKAKKMIGRTPDNIRVYRPLRDGVIADFRVTQAMLRYFIGQVKTPFPFIKPELVISIPAGITSTEKRAVIEAGMKAGAKEVFVAKEPILAAIGAGIPINSCSGNMIVDIGGGTSEIAVISLGGIVTSRSIRVAGDKMDSAISQYIKSKHNLAVGDQTIEKIKKTIGTALPIELESKKKKGSSDKKEITSMEIRGRDLVLGLPRNITITSNEVCEAISDRLNEIIQVIRNVLRETPAELSADIMDKGIVISGGGALLRNFSELIAKSTGVPCFVAENPLLCVVKGSGIVLDHLDLYKKSIMSKK